MATTASGVTAAHELDELYRLHAAEVFRYAYAVLGNRADAEDITQTTFVNALRALERGDRPRKPTNWLITIAHNLIRQRFRQQQARPLEVELDHDVAAVEDADDGPRSTISSARCSGSRRRSARRSFSASSRGARTPRSASCSASRSRRSRR